MGDLHDDDEVLALAPRKEYYPRMKKAMAAIPELDEHPHDIVEMLFSKDQQLWLRENLRS